ncbi:uncharacterized protein LOC143449991 isoform X3 [Clavelina lepadiformis]|uniref:uncharacterized protein LOC143449991 isoform X3 n=1 Tax=Clavelina lepadiformis TaxID=159417 RepID=UPI0040412309
MPTTKPFIRKMLFENFIGLYAWNQSIYPEKCFWRLCALKLHQYNGIGIRKKSSSASGGGMNQGIDDSSLKLVKFFSKFILKQRKHFINLNSRIMPT